MNEEEKNINQEWKPALELAKPGEEMPDIWIPNRRERRLMKKKGKTAKAVAKFYQEAIDTAKEHVNTPSYKNEIYKALYERIRERRENLERTIEENGIGTVEENGSMEGV